MNNILHLVTVNEVLIYSQTIQAVGGYWKEEEIGEYTTVTTESGRISGRPTTSRSLRTK